MKKGDFICNLFDGHYQKYVKKSLYQIHETANNSIVGKALQLFN